MAIQIPGGYILVCKCSITSVNDKLSKIGKILKSIFLNGPSQSVRDSGKVTVELTQLEDTASSEEQKDKENKEDKESSNKETTNKDSNDNKETAQEESYKYSIQESFYNIKRIFEDDNETDDSSVDDIDDTSDSNDNEENNDDKKVFKPGDALKIKVLLPNEGFTLWTIQLDKRANTTAVMAAIKSKDFKRAYQLARKGLNTAGLIPLAAETYMNSKSKLPFMGHCQYALDAGSNDKTENANFVSMAIAPLDGKKNNQTSQDIVFEIKFDIIGDISNGEIERSLNNTDKDNDEDNTSMSKKDFIKAMKELNSDSKNDTINLADMVSKWLKNKFKCIGDSKMYDNFNKLREFVSNQANDGNLEFLDDESDNIKKYSKLGAVKKSLIYY